MLLVGAAARVVTAEKAVEQARQLLGRDRGAAVLHLHLHLLGTLRQLGRNAHQHHRASLGKTRGVAEQVGQGALEERLVHRHLGIALDAQRQARVLQRRLVELHHLPRQRGQAHRRAAPGHGAAVGLREEEHVVDHRRQPLRLFEVGTQGLAQHLVAALARERQLHLADERGQRRAQFVCDIGVEGLELLVGAFEPLHQRIELFDPRQQFLGRVGEREPPVQARRRDAARLRCQRAQRAQAAAHEPPAAATHQRPGRERHGDEDPGPAAAHRRVMRIVGRVTRAHLATLQPGRGDLEVVHLLVRRLLQRRAGLVGIQRAAVGAPDLEVGAAAHRRIGAQAREHRLFTAAGGAPDDLGDELAARLQVLLVALEEDHLDHAPGDGEQHAEHEHREQCQLARKPRADRVAADRATDG